MLKKNFKEKIVKKIVTKKLSKEYVRNKLANKDFLSEKIMLKKNISK